MKEGIEGFKKEVDARKQHEVDTALAELREEKSAIERRYSQLLEDFNDFKNQCGWLDLLSGAYSKPKPIKPLKKTGSGEATAVAVGCDWHVFETVRPEQVNDLNEYNTEIAQKSVEAFFHGVLRWVEIHRAGTNIPHLVLAFLGDLITNMLHDDQKEGNAGTPQEEILFCLKLITAGIDMLLEHGDFKTITCVCCDGNHGRDTEKIRHAGRARHSHEWLMYQFLANKYEGRVKFVVAEGYHLYQQIYDYTIRFHHGDRCRYQGGVGGLTIPMNKAIADWNVARKADFDIFGHFHQSINPAAFLCAGSVIGYAPYSISIKAKYERPQQPLLLVDKNRFITSVNRIYVR